MENGDKAKALASEGANIISILLMGLAGLLMLAGICVLAYQAYQFVIGNGWTSLSAADVLDWLGVPPPSGTDPSVLTFITGILVTVPLALVLLVLAWICSKISDVIERLS